MLPGRTPGVPVPLIPVQPTNSIPPNNTNVIIIAEVK